MAYGQVVSDGIFSVWVPKPGSPISRLILPGSAIVGNEEYAMEGRIVIDVEGNKFGSMKDFDDQLLHALGRHVMKYPTIARFTPLVSELIEVGELYYANYQIVWKAWTDQETLDAWIAHKDH